MYVCVCGMRRLKGVGFVSGVRRKSGVNQPKYLKNQSNKKHIVFWELNLLTKMFRTVPM